MFPGVFPPVYGSINSNPSPWRRRIRSWVKRNRRRIQVTAWVFFGLWILGLAVVVWTRIVV